METINITPERAKQVKQIALQHGASIARAVNVAVARYLSKLENGEIFRKLGRKAS